MESETNSRSRGLFGKIARKLSQRGTTKGGSEARTAEGATKSTTGIGPPKVLFPGETLHRNSKIRRSLKNAKRILEMGLGSPESRTSPAERKNHEIDHLSIISLFGRDHLNHTTLWPSNRHAIKPTSEGKENCNSPETLNVKVDELGRPRPKPIVYPLSEKQPKIVEYLTEQEIADGDFYITIGEPKRTALLSEIKALYLNEMRNAIKQNQNWIMNFDCHPQGPLEFRERNDKYITFLQNLRNLLTYETGLLEEIYDRYDMLLEENELLHKLLVNKETMVSPNIVRSEV
ncbi:LAME_0G18426g1_1 [Lachancea meyersii CBS 8951]|uniref:LAME_0G18426g1_1 n=1 Tax=Lachancea meyersii CBS 8951 TaxID=1266667 RepID=A0A1G4KC31_9SACH|nr:LAME_0G18426g1_1 [Lachancea meyersii CBS 8951]